MAAPLILLEDPGELPLLRAKLAREGWRIQEGWELGEQSWEVGDRRVVCIGRVESEPDRDAALLAGARGAGLILSAVPELRPGLLEDLQRLGAVERRAPASEGSLDAETIDLLRALAAGRSMAEAADDGLMSLRTAHRRVAQARAVLGVRSRAELLVEFTRRYAP